MTAQPYEFPAPFPVADLVEDIEWLAESGTSTTEAARRTGFASRAALEKWLYRRGHGPLWLRLKTNDPLPLERAGKTFHTCY